MESQKRIQLQVASLGCDPGNLGDGALGSEAESGPFSLVTTFSQPDLECRVRHSFPSGQGRVKFIHVKSLTKV